MTVLEVGALHSAVTSRPVRAVSLFNSLMKDYPDAVSFAPGAPSLSFAEDLDVEGCLASYRSSRASSGVQGGATKDLYEYGPPGGLINRVLAQALNADLGLHLLPEELTVTVGAQEAMLLAVRALIAAPTDVLGIVTPCYPGLLAAAEILGVAVEAVPEADDDVDVAGVVIAVRRLRQSGRRLRLFYVAPDYANPSGTRMSLPARHALLVAAEAEDFYVLEDGAYAFTSDPEETVPSLLQLDTARRVVHVGTLAKVLAPGLRVGFVVAPQAVRGPAGAGTLAGALASLKGATTVSTPGLTQAVSAGWLLQRGESLASLGRSRAIFYRRQLAALLEALDLHCADLPGVSWNRPRGGFFVQMTLPFAVDLEQLRRSAEDHGVLWMPMAAFYPDGGQQTNVIRLSCSFVDEPKMFEGARRLASFVCAESAALSATRHEEPVVSDDPFDRYLNVLRATLPAGDGDAELRPEDRLRDLGLDSLLLVQLVVELEDEFRMTMPDDAIAPENFETVATVWETVSRSLSGSSPK